jgi:hypothetical protein
MKTPCSGGQTPIFRVPQQTLLIRLVTSTEQTKPAGHGSFEQSKGSSSARSLCIISPGAQAAAVQKFKHAIALMKLFSLPPLPSKTTYRPRYQRHLRLTVHKRLAFSVFWIERKPNSRVVIGFSLCYWQGTN